MTVDEARLPNIHPGEVIREDFMIPMKLSVERMAMAMRVHPEVVRDILAGDRITPEIALRLEKCLGSSARFWLNLQTSYELEHEMRRAWYLDEVKSLVGSNTNQ